MYDSNIKSEMEENADSSKTKDQKTGMEKISDIRKKSIGTGTMTGTGNYLLICLADSEYLQNYFYYFF